MQFGIEGIEKDAPRPGRFPSIPQEKKTAIVRKTTNETPPNATHWSRASMAEATGVSESTIGRIWRKYGLKPHLIRTFKISNDKRFAEKLEDIIGLYLNPPEHALVLSCDEKSQMQALDRTQPGLPLKKGRSGTMNVNGGNFLGPDAPFGGYKQSGVGREMGPEGFEEYLETKTVAIAV